MVADSTRCQRLSFFIKVLLEFYILCLCQKLDEAPIFHITTQCTHRTTEQIFFYTNFAAIGKVVKFLRNKHIHLRFLKVVSTF